MPPADASLFSKSVGREIEAFTRAASVGRRFSAGRGFLVLTRRMATA
jgi:hypothetical protein